MSAEKGNGSAALSIRLPLLRPPNITCSYLCCRWSGGRGVCLQLKDEESTEKYRLI